MRKKILFLQLLFAACTSHAQTSTPNPQLIKDIYPGTNGSDAQEVVRAGKYIFFTAVDTASGARRLYRTDGTAAGTIRLTLTSPGYISTTADHLTTFGDKIVFAADNSSGYNEVWVSDGTQAGTFGIENYISTAGSLGGFYVVGNYVYFSVHKNDTIQVRRIDTSFTKSTLVKSFNIDHTGYYDCSLFKAVNNNKVYFDYFSPADNTDQIWETNGTPSGTVMLKHLDTEGVESELMQSGKFLYFLTTGPFGQLLYTLDTDIDLAYSIMFTSTTSGSSMPDYLSLSSDGYNDTRMIFTFDDGVNGKEPWITDGTSAGTHILADIEPGSNSSSPQGYTLVGDKILFSAYTSTYGSEIWYTTTTANTCSLFQDIVPGTGSSFPAGFTAVGNRVFFAAYSLANAGNELFTADTTAGSAEILADINPGSQGSFPYGFTKNGYPVCFIATNSSTGNELYAINDITKIWTGKLSNDWSTNGNWSPPGVPLNSDNVMLPFSNSGTGTPAVTYLNNNASCDRLWLNGGIFTVASGKTLNILNQPNQAAIVSTTSAISTSSTSFAIGGNVSGDGGATIVERGVVWDTQANPVITNTNKVAKGAGTGSYTLYVNWLTPNTTYHVRAYAINSNGVSYGNDVTVSTTL